MQAWEEKIIERQEAREEGLAEGLASGIKVLIESLRELQIDDDKIKSKIVDKFNLSVEDAEKYMKEV